jgi:uroporphyrinogen III methyltransferase/synthase
MTNFDVTPGTVFLVGAGPGDPGAITLRAVECLQKADLILWDYLVNPVVVEHASPSAELVRLGKPNSGRALTPDEITETMLAAARAGRSVVRLKSGDASVFGRGADEMEALRNAGIPYEVVPGITAGLAVAAYSEIPVTHFAAASAVALVTGRERDEKTSLQLERGLAEFPGTLVFYMGVRKAPEWSRALMEQGKPPDTPVAIVRWCSRVEQKTVKCTLSTVADAIEEHGIRPPSLFVVGAVVDHSPAVSWFEARPLFGTTILVPGSPRTSEKLRRFLGSHGAEVILAPAIRIEHPDDWSPVDQALENLDRFDWLVFSSSNGVDFLMRRMFELRGDARWLSTIKLGAIGPGTAERLSEYFLNADLVPETFTADALAEALLPSASGQRFLLARASRGRDILAERLSEAGGEVTQVVVYASTGVEEADSRVSEALSEGEIDWVTVASSETATSLHRLYGPSLGRARLASISPLTSEALRGLGYEPTVEATAHTMKGIADAILEAHYKSEV